MDLFEKTTDYYNEILTKCKFNSKLVTKLQEQQQKRITPKFNEDENKQLDRNIYNSIIEITKKIKNCEENIKQISIIQLLSVAENDMKNNIKIYLASKLQDISKKVRINEEEYIIKFKEFCSNDFKNFYSSGNDHLENSFKKQPKSFLDLDKSNEMLKQRDVEINNLVNSISNLTQIFQDLAALVQDQGIKNVNKGTILDRIDYNIEVSLENTKKANICLRKTEKTLDKNCARNSIMILIIVIFIEAILLLLKIVNK